MRTVEAELIIARDRMVFGHDARSAEAGRFNRIAEVQRLRQSNERHVVRWTVQPDVRGFRDEILEYIRDVQIGSACDDVVVSRIPVVPLNAMLCGQDVSGSGGE